MSTQPSASGTVSSRFSRPIAFVRDLPIWTKLGLIMIVPTIATIVVGTAGLLDQVEQASGAERARSLTVLSGDAGTLVHGLQDERALAVRLLNAAPAEVEPLKAAFTKQQEGTTAAQTKYRISRTTIADIPTNLQALLDSIESNLAQLQVVRGQVVERKIALSATEQQYQELITGLLDIRELSSQLTGDTTLTDRMRSVDAIATANEFLSQERVIVLSALAGNEFSPATERKYIAALKGQELATESFMSVATPDQRELRERTLAGPQARDIEKYQGALESLPNGASPNSAFNIGDWEKAVTGYATLLNTVEAQLNTQAQAAAVDLGARVQRRVLVETGLLLMTLLLGVLFAWLVARSMARALRDLRQGALAVAQYGLPQAVARLRDPALASHLSPAGVALQIAEPLPVRSNDEFGQVTEAFNAVHLEAVRTAAEQAALRSSVATMFVNLARRSQILVDRLIGHLDRLERGEQDPDRLSELFQLDHLATRMRRNDENLLVLAGADSTRIQREPAALMDVLRAAQSEVEHYTRIDFTYIDQDIEIAAHAVNDLVHLVAELFDNATAFSPPDSSIRIEARRVGDRAVLRVEDRGIGMSPEQYAELNDRLATPPMVDVAVSRMMGLVVVARLAARHGVKVELLPAAERGTVADVLLPGGVLVPRALAGRTHAPSGFPAVRQQEAPVPRPNFGPPLALESGPTGGWDDGRGGRGPGMPPTFGPPGPPPAYGPGAPAPAYGGQAGPPAFGAGFGAGAAAAGLGAALAGSGMGHSGPTANGGPHTNGGRGAMPAWYDLTGATPQGQAGPPPGMPGPPGRGFGPTETDPLPQRRPGPWGDEPGPGIPHQGGGDARWGEPPPGLGHEGFGQGGYGPGGYGDPGVPGQGGPGYGAPGYGDPGYGQSGPPPGYSAHPGYGGPPAPSRPPAWPPVAGDDPGRGIPERLSASLDMTSEMSRARAGEQHVPARGADDMTMELPIFRELESAWFSAGPAGPEATAGARTGGWSSEGSTMTGSARAQAGAGWSDRGAEGASRSAGDVSWRTHADDGWRAAQAAAEPADGGTTDFGLPRRVPMAQLVPGGVETAPGVSDRRTPDSVRGLLSAYHRGVQRGRDAHGNDTDPTGPYSTGKEQEA